MISVLRPQRVTRGLLPVALFFPEQRHFSVFTLSFPGADALSSIYSAILTQHLKLGSFPAALHKSVPQLLHLALTFHQKIATTFLPTAIKFHYIFNLRDFANIFQVSPTSPGHLWRLDNDPVLSILGQTFQQRHGSYGVMNT